jgi:pyruvate formate lyase activating enzyme
MSCPFCQNHSIAHPTSQLRESEITFEELIALAKRESIRAAAYTYNEPTLQTEYILAASRFLKDEGIATVMVTNGMFSESVCEEAVRLVDAMNIDVKTFDAELYRRLGGSLGVVRRNVERLAEGGVHIELTNLVVPGVSAEAGDFARMVDWIAGLSRDIPLHISRYFPAFKYETRPTDVSLIRNFYDAALEKLNYVYMGNV